MRLATAASIRLFGDGRGVAEGVAHLVGTEPELGEREHEPVGGGQRAHGVHVVVRVGRLVGDEGAALPRVMTVPSASSSR